MKSVANFDDSGERAAATYTLTGSAKLNSLDPGLYLRPVLERIANHPIPCISELLPWNISLTTQPTLVGIHTTMGAHRRLRFPVEDRTRKN